MGAQSDFIAEQFVPNERYKSQQMEMAQRLIASGVNPEQMAKIFLCQYTSFLMRSQKIGNGHLVVLSRPSQESSLI